MCKVAWEIMGLWEERDPSQDGPLHISPQGTLSACYVCCRPGPQCVKIAPLFWGTAWALREQVQGIWY